MMNVDERFHEDKLALAQERREVAKIPFTVRMLAHQSEDPDIKSGAKPSPAYRVVEVPATELEGSQEHVLDRVFYYGQNDFQNKSSERCCSVSVGDVIFIENRPFVVQGVGFKELTLEEMLELENTDQRDRTFHELVRPRK